MDITSQLIYLKEMTQYIDKN